MVTRVLVPDETGGWLVFTEPREILTATSPDKVVEVLARAESAAQQGFHVAGYVTYEAASAFDAALAHHPAGPLPLLSFGVFNAPGLEMNLRGDANDYVGKGMAGGRLVIAPPEGSQFATQDTSIIGNTCLYGATGGTLYAAGRAGERFAVRNSGATAIVEGAGDHCCEYMTGGLVIVLGKTGRNFGAGMTGGFAYVLDESRTFVDRYNHELVEIARVSTEHMEQYRAHLRSQIRDYVDATNSQWGQTILDDFESFVSQFWLVKPKAASLGDLLASSRSGAQ